MNNTEQEQEAIAGEAVNLPASDGYILGGYRFGDVLHSKGVIIIAGGTGIPQRYYRRFAVYLAEQGYLVYTFDYRGIGDSLRRSIRGFTAYFHEWGERDIQGVIKYLAARYDGRPLHLVGHSAGGQMVGLAENITQLSSIVTIATQSGFYGHWPLPRKLFIWSCWHGLFPALTNALGYFPGKLGVGENLPAGVALEWARWGRNPHYLFSSGRPSVANYSRYKGPMLAIGATDDTLAPVPAMEYLSGRYVNARLDKWFFSPTEVGQKQIGHFRFFRPELQATVWKRISSYLDVYNLSVLPAVSEDTLDVGNS